jgi:hypothetical protein
MHPFLDSWVLLSWWVGDGKVWGWVAMLIQLCELICVAFYEFKAILPMEFPRPAIFVRHSGLHSGLILLMWMFLWSKVIKFLGAERSVGLAIVESLTVISSGVRGRVV